MTQTSNARWKFAVHLWPGLKSNRTWRQKPVGNEHSHLVKRFCRCKPRTTSRTTTSEPGSGEPRISSMGPLLSCLYRRSLESFKPELSLRPRCKHRGLVCSAGNPNHCHACPWGSIVFFKYNTESTIFLYHYFSIRIYKRLFKRTTAMFRKQRPPSGGREHRFVSGLFDQTAEAEHSRRAAIGPLDLFRTWRVQSDFDCQLILVNAGAIQISRSDNGVELADRSITRKNAK